MRPFRPGRILLAAAVLMGAALAALAFLNPARVASARGSEVRVADSVCEAQRLKALAAGDPELQIEIPAEYDKPYPSLAACRAHDQAWDPEAPGPRQPIPFSHQLHATEYGIQCLYCHSGTSRSQAAGVPSVELCMGCHEHFAKELDRLEGIQILKDHWQEDRPIEWVQVHWVPEHVQFRHNRHVAAGVECQTCHGPVQDMHKLSVTPDTVWVNGLPSAKLMMGWCVTCHNQQRASVDCLTCHY